MRGDHGIGKSNWRAHFLKLHTNDCEGVGGIAIPRRNCDAIQKRMHDAQQGEFKVGQRNGRRLRARRLHHREGGRQWRVFLQAEGEDRTTPSQVGQFYVRNDAGTMVPLSALQTRKASSGSR